MMINQKVPIFPYSLLLVTKAISKRIVLLGMIMIQNLEVFHEGYCHIARFMVVYS